MPGDIRQRFLKNTINGMLIFEGQIIKTIHFQGCFDPGLMEYTQQYENSLHFSPRFQEYAKKLVEYLVEKYNLRGKSIIDIGCGKGDFLKMIVTEGNNKGFGFDPSYEPALDDENYDIDFILDFYSPKYNEKNHYPQYSI